MRGCVRCRRNSWRATRPRRRRHVMVSEIADNVPRDCAGAREIGFNMPERYNASRVLFDNLGKGFGGRLALTGPAGTRELCRALRGGLPLGQRLHFAGLETR